MYEDCFVDMTDREKRDVADILERLSLDKGTLYQVDGFGDYVEDGNVRVPLAWTPVHGKRFLVDNKGRVWRMFAQGTSKDPHGPGGGGAKWNSHRVEMWTGDWRKARVGVKDGEPAYEYAKSLRAISLAGGVGKYVGYSHIDFYLNEKHWKHPYDKPDTPSKREIAALEKGEAVMRPMILAKQQELVDAGHDKPENLGLPPEPKSKPKTTRKKAAPKRRSNKRKVENAA